MIGTNNNRHHASPPSPSDYEQLPNVPRAEGCGMTELHDKPPTSATGGRSGGGMVSQCGGGGSASVATTMARARGVRVSQTGNGSANGGGCHGESACVQRRARWTAMRGGGVREHGRARPLAVRERARGAGWRGGDGGGGGGGWPTSRQPGVSRAGGRLPAPWQTRSCAPSSAVSRPPPGWWFWTPCRRHRPQARSGAVFPSRPPPPSPPPPATPPPTDPSPPLTSEWQAAEGPSPAPPQTPRGGRWRAGRARHRRP